MAEPGVWWYGGKPRLGAAWARCAARLADWLGWLATGAAAVAAALTGLLALLTLALVVARYCFAWNDTGLEELKWHLFGTAVMLGGAWCLAHDGHVRMDLVYGRLPRRARAVIDALAMLLIVLPFCGLVAWYGAEQTLDSFERGELSRNAGGLTNRWFIRSTIPIGFTLLGLQGLAQLLRALVVAVGGARSNDAIDEDPSGSEATS